MNVESFIFVTENRWHFSTSSTVNRRLAVWDFEANCKVVTQCCFSNVVSRNLVEKTYLGMLVKAHLLMFPLQSATKLICKVLRKTRWSYFGICCLTRFTKTVSLKPCVPDFPQATFSEFETKFSVFEFPKRRTGRKKLEKNQLRQIRAWQKLVGTQKRQPFVISSLSFSWKKMGKNDIGWRWVPRTTSLFCKIAILWRKQQGDSAFE